MPILFLTLLTSFVWNRVVEGDKIKSAKIKFRYHNTVREGEIFEATNYFDNYGEKTLTVFNEQRGTDILKILKRDTIEYNFLKFNWFAEKRVVDICTDPVIKLNGTNLYMDDYTTSNRRDTIYNKMKCLAYDLVFTNNKKKGILITFKNIKMYYYCDFGDIKNSYAVVSLDTSNSAIKPQLFKIPK